MKVIEDNARYFKHIEYFAETEEEEQKLKEWANEPHIPTEDYDLKSKSHLVVTVEVD